MSLRHYVGVYAAALVTRTASNAINSLVRFKCRKRHFPLSSCGSPGTAITLVLRPNPVIITALQVGMFRSIDLCMCRFSDKQVTKGLHVQDTSIWVTRTCSGVLRGHRRCVFDVIRHLYNVCSSATAHQPFLHTSAGLHTTSLQLMMAQP